MNHITDAMFGLLRLHVWFWEQSAHSCVTVLVMMRNTADAMLPDPMLLLGRAIDRRNGLDDV